MTRAVDSLVLRGKPGQYPQRSINERIIVNRQSKQQASMPGRLLVPFHGTSERIAAAQPRGRNP